MEIVYGIFLDRNEMAIREYVVNKEWTNKNGKHWIELVNYGVISGTRLCRDHELFFRDYDKAKEFAIGLAKKKIESNLNKIAALQGINKTLEEQVKKFEKEGDG